jgi:hypothetical protein
MPCKNVTIRGLVLDATTREPLEGLSLEVLGLRPNARNEEPIGAASTNSAGAFHIAAALAEGAAVPSRLRLEVRDASGRLIDDVEGAMTWSLDAPPDRIVLAVRAPAALDRACPRPPALRRAYAQVGN